MNQSLVTRTPRATAHSHAAHYRSLQNEPRARVARRSPRSPPSLVRVRVELIGIVHHAVGAAGDARGRRRNGIRTGT